MQADQPVVIGWWQKKMTRGSLERCVGDWEIGNED